MELFVGGSTVEELEVDGRVASVEAGRVAKGVEVVELFVVVSWLNNNFWTYRYRADKSTKFCTKLPPLLIILLVSLAFYTPSKYSN